MLKKLKTKLGFIYRGLIGIKDNIFDNPKIIDNIKSESIGKTVLGEDIKLYKFGSGEEKILYFGGIHGNEIGTVKLMNRWVNFLSKNKDTYEGKQIFIIPCLNVDGCKKALKNREYFSGGKIGKTNANKVDLNRNFPTSNRTPESKLFASGKYYDVSAGEKAGGEPELKAFLDFVKKESIKTIYVFHNCWSTVMGTFTDSSDKKTLEYSKNSGYRVFTKRDWDNLRNDQKTGHGTVWGIENSIDFIEIETKTRWGSGWKENKKALVDSVRL